EEVDFRSGRVIYLTCGHIVGWVPPLPEEEVALELTVARRRNRLTTHSTCRTPAPIPEPAAGPWTPTGLKELGLLPMKQTTRDHIKRRVWWCAAAAIGGWLLFALGGAVAGDLPHGIPRAAIPIAGFLLCGGAILAMQRI